MRTYHLGRTPAADRSRRAADRAVTPAPRPHAAIHHPAADNGAANPGRPVAARLADGMQVRLGADFSHVRVHTDPTACPGATEAGTLAAASGSQVVIGDGRTDKPIFALQRDIGNAAVSRMLDQARHQRGAGFGHQRIAPASVQRSAVRDVVSGPGQPLAVALTADMQARPCADFPHVPARADAAPSITHEVLQGPGASLDARTRDLMERRLGADFSRVRVHTDARAAASADAVNAVAYTVGSSIVFSPGRYAPHTDEGQRVLAHELVHTLQQGGSEPPLSGQRLSIESPTSPAENEARMIEAAVAPKGVSGAQPAGNRAVTQMLGQGSGGACSARRDGPTSPKLQRMGGGGTFRQVRQSEGVQAVTEDFVRSHTGSAESEAKEIATIRYQNDGITTSHTIRSDGLKDLIGEMRGRQQEGYYVAENRKDNPNGNPGQFLTQNEYPILETKTDNRGRQKEPSVKMRKFYYDVLPANGACHHFDGVAESGA